MKRPFFLALACALALTGCAGPVQSTPTPQPTPTPASVQADLVENMIFAMDTVMIMKVYGGQEDLDAISGRINGIEHDLSVTREGSQVWQVNHADGAPVSVGQDFLNLMDLARDLGDKTGGALDVTMYPVVRAWGFTTDEYAIPDDETISSLLDKVDYTAITVKDDTVTLPAGMEMDLGAIAKGYAGQMAAELLRERGVTSALLNMGGNVQAVGSKPDGSPWNVGIQDPRQSTGGRLGRLAISDLALVTSGGYERYFEEDGVRYWHIMDPATGAPARSGLVSVTIIAHDGGLCDGLSTALFILGLEDAIDYWKTYGGFEAIFIDENDVVWITPGLDGNFILESPDYTLKVVEE